MSLSDCSKPYIELKIQQSMHWDKYRIISLYLNIHFSKLHYLITYSVSYWIPGNFDSFHMFYRKYTCGCDLLKNNKF